MSKFLVDSFSNEVRSTHEAPLNFSVAGKYVVDIPTKLQVQATSQNVNDLITAKLAAFTADHPSLPNRINDEFITSPNIDFTNSSRYLSGPNKRTMLFPAGGQITTNAIAVPAFNNVLGHWHGFTLHTEPANLPSPVNPPGPDRLLYNWSTILANFQEFISSTFTVQILDGGTLAVLASLTFDTEQSLVFGGGTIRLRITNSDPDRAFYISDWLLLHD